MEEGRKIERLKERKRRSTKNNISALPPTRGGEGGCAGETTVQGTEKYLNNLGQENYDSLEIITVVVREMLRGQ